MLSGQSLPEHTQHVYINIIEMYLVDSNTSLTKTQLHRKNCLKISGKKKKKVKRVVQIMAHHKHIIQLPRRKIKKLI